MLGPGNSDEARSRLGPRHPLGVVFAGNVPPNSPLMCQQGDKRYSWFFRQWSSQGSDPGPEQGGQDWGPSPPRELFPAGRKMEDAGAGAGSVEGAPRGGGPAVAWQGPGSAPWPAGVTGASGGQPGAETPPHRMRRGRGVSYKAGLLAPGQGGSPRHCPRQGKAPGSVTRAAAACAGPEGPLGGSSGGDCVGGLGLVVEPV